MKSDIVHIYQWWNADVSTTKRMQAAKSTWTSQRMLVAEFRPENSIRNSLTLGEKQQVPYIKDIIAFGLKAFPNNNLFLYTNSDSSLVKNATKFIKDSLKKFGCGYSHR